MSGTTAIRLRRKRKKKDVAVNKKTLICVISLISVLSILLLLPVFSGSIMAYASTLLSLSTLFIFGGMIVYLAIHLLMLISDWKGSGKHAADSMKFARLENGELDFQPEAKNNVPPLGSYSNSSNSATSTSEKAPPSIPTNPKNNPFSIGTTIFLTIAVLVTVGTAAVLWFKNNKPKPKQQSVVNYSNENTDDIVNLILSPMPSTSVPPTAAKSPPKKLLLKPATKPKDKGGFEVRV